MTDRRPGDDEDHAWLLARERGEPGPAISDARARRYAQLGRLIADLPVLPPAAVEQRGWEQAVLAAIDADAGPSAGQGETPSIAATAAASARRRTATATAAMLLVAAGVAVVVFAQRGGKQAARVGAPPVVGDERPLEHTGAPNLVPEVTRGLHVEGGRLGFDHAVQVRRSETAVPHELRDGDTVISGDRIRASVRTSTGAALYLAFCAGQHLQIYPSQQGVRTRAGDLMVIPEGGGELVVDDHPGSEVLYLILSRNELSLADPQLAGLVAAAGDTATTVDCGASLDRRLMKSAGSPAHVLRGETIPRKHGKSPQAPDLRADPGDRIWYATDGAGDPGSVVAADSDGIAIVRYRFTHVAPKHGDDRGDDRGKARND